MKRPWLFVLIIAAYACPIIAEGHLPKAEDLQKKGEYSAAITEFKEAIAEEKLKARPEPSVVAQSYWGIASCSVSLDDHRSAIASYRELLKMLQPGCEIAQTVQLSLGLSFEAVSEYSNAMACLAPFVDDYGKNQKSTLINGLAFLFSGRIHEYQGEYDVAWSNYCCAVGIFSDLNDYLYTAESWFALGEIDSSRGQYEDGLKALDKALEGYKALKYDLGIARTTIETAALNCNIGNYDEALSQSKKAMEILASSVPLKNGKREAKQDASYCYLRYAQICDSLDKSPEAKDAYKQALQLSIETQDQYTRARALLGLGELSFKADAPNDCDALLGEAKEIAAKCQFAAVDASIDYEAGKVAEFFRKDYPLAAEKYKTSLATFRKQVDNFSTARVFSRLGVVYQNMGEYDRSIMYLKQATNLTEGVLRSLKGGDRLDFVAMQIAVYEDLVAAYISNGSPEQALYAAEFAKAKYLTEQMRQKAGGKQYDSYMNYLLNVSQQKVDSARKSLDSHTAILFFSTLPDDSLALCTLTAGNISWSRLALSPEAISAISNGTLAKAASGVKLRGLAVVGEKKASAEKIGWALAVETYRNLISNPRLAPSERNAADALSRELCDSILSPATMDALRDKENIVIIPDGALSSLPFETLRLPDGSYFVERFNVSYLPSFAVGDLLATRKSEGERKPLLAFGGALYDGAAPAKSAIDPSLGSESLNKMAAYQSNRGLAVNGLYDAMQIKWPNLPGTLAEVKGLKEIYPDGDLISGPNVTEAQIKKMSASGELSNYRAIHFATHGIVFPQMPELSAIVLSMSGNGAEDGYLRMSEVSNLNLKADFICLSACETGLGRIYSGEGVIGLTQAFFVAGANSVCSSLWQVDDEATKKFMLGLYKLVAAEKISYKEAIVRMKRKFIKSDYSASFYWAPFIYYGQ
jgi:CHAT domain-containing protein